MDQILGGDFNWVRRRSLHELSHTTHSQSLKYGFCVAAENQCRTRAWCFRSTQW